MRLILKPDWDPSNPYHYHVNGQKVVITPEDWEKYKNDPTFREVRAAVEAEQAAYPKPEYDEVENPAWRQAYQRLVNGVNLKGRSNYNLPLPQGYTRDKKGVAMDAQGNYYIPVETATDAPYFINQERGMMGHIVPVRYEQQQMPERTIRQLRQPLPVDRVMNVDNIRKASIDSYIENHTTPKKKIHYINSAFVSYLYPELATKSSDKTEYNRAVKSAKKLGFKVLDNYTPGQFNSFLIGFNDIDFEKWKKEMYDRFGDGENDVYFDNTTLNETINSGKTWRDGPNGSMGYQVRYEGGSPSHQEAEKKAVIKVGDLEKVGTFAKGGKLINKCLNGERVNMSKLVTNSKGIPLKVDNNLLEELDNFLIKQNVGLPQRLAILYTVVQEGSTAGSHGNGAYGYLGWRGSRIPGKGVNQMQYLYDTIFGEFNKDLWNHGGAGSGYMSGREALQSFINATNVNDALRSLNYGYVRPELELREFRSKTKYFNEDEEVN